MARTELLGDKRTEEISCYMPTFLFTFLSSCWSALFLPGGPKVSEVSGHLSFLLPLHLLMSGPTEREKRKEMLDREEEVRLDISLI